MNKYVIFFISFYASCLILCFLVNPLIMIYVMFALGPFVLAYLSLMKYSNLIMEPVVSASGFRMRLNHLKKYSEKASTLGFKENSVYRLNTLFIPDIVCLFKHEKEPLFLEANHHGRKITLSIYTYFEPKGSLITCSSPGPGNLPPFPDDQIRMLKTEDLENLLAEHMKGVEFIKQNSYKEKDLTLEEFTGLYLRACSKINWNF